MPIVGVSDAEAISSKREESRTKVVEKFHHRHPFPFVSRGKGHVTDMWPFKSMIGKLKGNKLLELTSASCILFSCFCG